LKRAAREECYSYLLHGRDGQRRGQKVPSQVAGCTQYVPRRSGVHCRQDGSLMPYATATYPRIDIAVNTAPLISPQSGVWGSQTAEVFESRVGKTEQRCTSGRARIHAEAMYLTLSEDCNRPGFSSFVPLAGGRISDRFVQLDLLPKPNMPQRATHNSSCRASKKAPLLLAPANLG
jgi:hypothetical protein